MKIDKRNLKNDTPIFGNLSDGDIFVGTPIDASYEGIFMKINTTCDFVFTDPYEDAGLALDLEDGIVMPFRLCAGVRKIEGTLTLS